MNISLLLVAIFATGKKISFLCCCRCYKYMTVVLELCVVHVISIIVLRFFVCVSLSVRL